MTNNPELLNLDIADMDDFEIALHTAILQGRVTKHTTDEGETLYTLAPQN